MEDEDDGLRTRVKVQLLEEEEKGAELKGRNYNPKHDREGEKMIKEQREALRIIL